MSCTYSTWQGELQERKDSLNNYFEHLWVLVEWLVTVPFVFRAPHESMN